MRRAVGCLSSLARRDFRDRSFGRRSRSVAFVAALREVVSTLSCRVPGRWPGIRQQRHQCDSLPVLSQGCQACPRAGGYQSRPGGAAWRRRRRPRGHLRGLPIMSAPSPDRQRESTAKFGLGRIVATPNALSKLSNEDILRALQRHQAGDWGDVDEHDRQENELSLKEGFRLLSVFHSAQRVKFWIITESDRSSTTLLLPEDY